LGQLGIAGLAPGKFYSAAERLEKARALAPDNDQIYYLIGLLESNRGRPAEAITALKKAVELNPKNLRGIYLLATEVERQQNETNEAEVQRLIRQILSVQPDNLAALLELARIAAKRGDAETLHSTIAQIAAQSPGWPPEVQQQLSQLQTAAAGPDPRSAATRVTFLRNVLVRVPKYRQGLAAIKPPPGDEAIPFTSFLKLESPTFAPAVADTGLSFAPQPRANIKNGQGDWAAAIFTGSEGAPVVVVANSREVSVDGGKTFPFPGGAAATVPAAGILAMDFN